MNDVEERRQKKKRGVRVLKNVPKAVLVEKVFLKFF